jgi:hypothetical protein
MSYQSLPFLVGDHSPFRLRLRHPLLCYTVPWVISISLPNIQNPNPMTRLFQNPNSLTGNRKPSAKKPCAENPPKYNAVPKNASLRFVLPQHNILMAIMTYHKVQQYPSFMLSYLTTIIYPPWTNIFISPLFTCIQKFVRYFH